MSRRGSRPLPLVVLAVVLASAVYAQWRPDTAAPGSAGLRGGIPAGAQEAVVERVVDGDTLWVRVDGPGGSLPAHATSKIRLLEIDTPETVAPNQGVQCGGPQATAFAQERLPVGSTVYLLADREDVDQYGRFLRYLWTDDGAFFNLDAVRTGHARAVLFEPNDAYIQQLRAAEAQARGEGLGLWGEFCPTETGARSAIPDGTSKVSGILGAGA